MKIGSGEELYIDGKIYQYGTGKTYLIQEDITATGDYSNISNLIKNNQVVIEGNKHKITIQDSNGKEKYYTEASKYYIATNKYGYVTDGLQLLYDGIDNSGTGVHNNDATIWKDLSGNGKDGTIELNGKTVQNTEVKEAYGATWIKVFHHKTNSATTLFTSESEALWCNSADKYSQLSSLESYRNANGEFEFLLEYPGQSGYNRWKQTSNPTTTQESVTGYQAVNISWTGSSWGGLCKSSTSVTLLDGSVNHSNWWYAIGTYSAYQGGIPGPSSVVVDEVYLWARIDNLQNSIPELGNPINNLEIKQAYNATWLKVLYHKTHSGATMFASEAEALSCNSSYKYSLLNKLEDYRNANGEFEFLLEYPSQSGYNRWKQTSNPTTTEESVTGYQAVNISWTDNHWGGLCKSSDSETFIDGSVNHSNWFYAIGAYASWNSGIPAASTAVDEVYLWVRIDNLGKSGWKENGFKFDGLNDSVLIEQMNYDNVTLEAVVSFNSITDEQDEMCIITNYQAGGYGLFLYKKLCFQMYSSTSGRYERYWYNNYYPEANKKYSISGSYNGSSVSYRENNNENTGMSAGTLKQSASNTILALGGNPSRTYTNEGYLDGIIYSVRVYNRALTQDEVQTNYLADKARYEI